MNRWPSDRQSRIRSATRIRPRGTRWSRVVRDEQGALCGACLVQVRVLPRLRQPMYYMRSSGVRVWHGPGDPELHNATCDALEAYNRTLERPRRWACCSSSKAVFPVVPLQAGVPPEGDSTFIGYSPRGLQMRVSISGMRSCRLPRPCPPRSVAHAGCRLGRACNHAPRLQAKRSVPTRSTSVQRPDRPPSPRGVHHEDAIQP